jgi:serine/threonine protein kinase
MPETKIGKYTIVGEIGRGAMGIVYKAIDPFIGRTVAIKTIRFDLLGTGPEREIAQKRFIREAHSAGNLSHPNIVTIYDVGEDQGLSYIAMEYVDGSSLDELMHARQKFSLDEILNLIIQVAEGLESAHKKGVVHRDIKPANILIGSDGRPRIVDFGIARISTSTMTQTNMIMGTPYYMSPEQISGRRVDNRADIFALGGILYELLTGQKPFPGDNLTTVIYKIINEEPMPVRTFQKTVPEGLDYVVRRALAKSPDDRYQACREMIRDLEHYPELRLAEPTVALPAESIPVPAPAPIFREPRQKARPAQGSRKGLVITLSSIAAVGLIIGAVWLFSSRSGASSQAGLSVKPVETAPPASTAAPVRPESGALLEQGQRLSREQKYAEAMAVLDQIPESAREYFEARLAAAAILEAQDRPGLAASEYRRLIRLDPKDGRPYLHLGQLDERKNDLASALANYRKFIEISPEGVDAEGVRWKVKTLEARTQPTPSSAVKDAASPPRQSRPAAPEVSVKTEAKPGPASVPASLPPAAPAQKTENPAALSESVRTVDVAPMLEAGRKAFEKKNYAQAVLQLKAVLDADPGNTSARSLYDAAKAKYDEETKQATVKNELEQARAALKAGDYAEAIVQSRRALALDESTSEAKKIIGAAVIKAAPADIKLLLDRYLQAVRQSGLKSFYSLNGTPEFFQRINREAEAIASTYENLQVSGTNLDVGRVKESAFDRYETEATFAQVMTGMVRDRGTREILFEGKIRWTLVNSGGGWRISEITAYPRNQR